MEAQCCVYWKSSSCTQDQCKFELGTLQGARLEPYCCRSQRRQPAAWADYCYNRHFLDHRNDDRTCTTAHTPCKRSPSTVPEQTWWRFISQTDPTFQFELGRTAYILSAQHQQVHSYTFHRSQSLAPPRGAVPGIWLLRHMAIPYQEGWLYWGAMNWVRGLTIAQNLVREG